MVALRLGATTSHLTPDHPSKRRRSPAEIDVGEQVPVRHTIQHLKIQVDALQERVGEAVL